MNCFSASTSQASTSAGAIANEEMDSVTLCGDVIRLRKEEVRHLNSSVAKYKAENVKMKKMQKMQTEYKAVLGQKRSFVFHNTVFVLRKRVSLKLNGKRSSDDPI